LTQTFTGSVAVVIKHFSPASIIKLDPLIKDSISLLCRRLDEHRQAKKVVELGMAYRCVAHDVISEYAVPVAPTLLEDDYFAADSHYIIRDWAVMGIYNRRLLWLLPLMLAMPRWMVSLTSSPPALRIYDDFKVC
jgi:hypothetical protein